MNSPNSLVPVGAAETAILQHLLDTAKDQVFADHGDVVVDETAAQAEITQRMLIEAERQRTLQRAAQGFIVAYVTRNDLWKFHPDGYTTLRDFLKNSGLDPTQVSRLNSLGEHIIPYCDAHDISIDPYLTEKHWSKLRAAISVLRKATAEDDPDQVRAILEDVRKAVDRDAIRSKYAKKKEKVAHGTTVALADGRTMLVAVCDDEEAVRKLISRINGAIQWDLVLGASVAGGSLKLVIQDE